MKDVLLFSFLLIVIVVIGPFWVIWSFNTLFPLSIPYNFSTWLAVIIIGGVFNTAPK